MGMEALMTSGTALVTVLFTALVTVLVAFFPAACCNSMTSTKFMMTKDKQLPSEACQEVSSFRRMSRVQCAGACCVTPDCQGFSFTCADLHLGSSCHCLVCSAADLSAASTSPFGTSGVFTSQRVLQSFTTTISPTTTPQPTTTTLQPACSPPPLIERTTVTHSVNATHGVAHYSCSVSTDVYVRGTADVTCTEGSSWPTATILCAPTTCWTTHPTWGPVYAGTVSVSKAGVQCQPWILNSPKNKTEMYNQNNEYMSDNDDKTAASNYCRIFKDNYNGTWCYLNDANSERWDDCDVPQCGVVPGQHLP